MGSKCSLHSELSATDSGKCLHWSQMVGEELEIASATVILAASEDGNLLPPFYFVMSAGHGLETLTFYC